LQGDKDDFIEFFLRPRGQQLDKDDCRVEDFVATVVFVVFEVVFNDQLVVPCGGFFVATVVFVVFEVVFNDRLVVPCGGFFVATINAVTSSLN
jgi:hypothetical protein